MEAEGPLDQELSNWTFVAKAQIVSILGFVDQETIMKVSYNKRENTFLRSLLMKFKM